VEKTQNKQKTTKMKTKKIETIPEKKHKKNMVVFFSFGFVFLLFVLIFLLSCSD